MDKPFGMKLSKDDIRACGRVAVWGAMLDATMEVAMWLLEDAPELSAAERARRRGLPAGEKRRALKEYCENANVAPASRDSLKRIVDRLENAIKERNFVIHPVWYVGVDGEMWALKHDRAGNLEFNRKLSGSDVHGIAEECKTLARALAEWCNGCRDGVVSDLFPPAIEDEE